MSNSSELSLRFAAPETDRHVLRLPFLKAITALCIVSFCVVRWMGTYPLWGDITEVPPGATDYFILLSLSLSLLLQRTRDPHILNMLSTRANLAGRIQCLQDTYKRRKEISCVWSMCFLTQISTWPSSKVTVLWCRKYVPRRGFWVTSSQSQHLRKKFYLSHKKSSYWDKTGKGKCHCLVAYAQNIVSAKNKMTQLS